VPLGWQTQIMSISYGLGSYGEDVGNYQKWNQPEIASKIFLAIDDLKPVMSHNLPFGGLRVTPEECCQWMKSCVTFLSMDEKSYSTSSLDDACMHDKGRACIPHVFY